MSDDLDFGFDGEESDDPPRADGGGALSQSSGERSRIKTLLTAVSKKQAATAGFAAGMLANTLLVIFILYVG